MQHWLQIATRSWRTRPARNILAVLSITLGVGIVVWVTCCYESVRRGMNEVVLEWIGRSHIIIESSTGVWGYFEDDVESLARDVPGIRHTTTRTREFIEAAPPPDDSAAAPDEQAFVRIEVTGVVPKTERLFRKRTLAAGRFLKSDDSGAVVIERLLAEQFGLETGDAIFLRHKSPPHPINKFTVVGIIDRRRASMNQAMMVWGRLDEVQSLCKLPNMIKAVDIIVANPNMENIRRIAGEIETIIDKRRIKPPADDPRSAGLEVKTTEAQHKRLGTAQGLLRFIMMLLSCVVLLTAFFIIMATMSMGVTERITEFGLLRCVGVTRRQLGGLVLLQTIPFGVAGTLAGVPLGLALQWLTLRVVPDYLGEFAYNPWGIALAICGGIGTSLLGAAAPAVRAFEISPVEATRAAGDPRILRWVWFFAILGFVLLITHEIVNHSLARVNGSGSDTRAMIGIVLLYFGGAMLVPAMIVLIGRLAVFVAARILRLSPQLLGDEITRAPFRSAAICCGLMVGLSLIVGLVVWGESVKEGWQFPKEFPDALLYSYIDKPLKEMKALRKTEGIAEFTVTDDFPFLLRDPAKRSFLTRFSLKEQFQRCLAIDPEEGFTIVKLTFLEGNQRDAKAKLKQGGHILITREFARAYDRGLGDKVRIWVPLMNGKFATARFTIAGVIASPGLDIAISFFNAGTYFQSYAVGAIIGTLDDAKHLFGREYGRLVLFNFKIEDNDSSRIVSESTQTIGGITKTNVQGRPTFALGSGPIPGDGPEERIINHMLEQIDYPPKAFVTARELKQQIDRNINRVTLLLLAIPVVGLLIAALGMGNLMAANVASRSKHLAVLRAIGVTRGQLSRMIVGEALVLALIGSGLGLGLGLALARASNTMTEHLSGFRPEFAIPWGLVALGAALATLLCVLAALLPARHAGRSNIVAALADL